MSENLFSEFAPSDKTAWKKQAEKELNGSIAKLKNLKITDTDYAEPYLTAEDINWKQVEDLQNCQKKTPGWFNIPGIEYTSPGLTNLKIKSTLSAGAQGILLDIKKTDPVKCEFHKLLHSVRLSDTPVYFETEQNANAVFDLILNGAGYYIKGGIAHDPLAHWMRTGQDYRNSVDEVAALSKKTKSMREFYPVMVESHVYHNAGATPVQELAFMTATLVSYMDVLTDAGIPPLQAINRFFFSISVGTENLTEIAKLRAFRFLYRKVSRAYQLPDELCNAFIHVSTSSFLNAQQLPHNNIIRSTSEAISAVTGGCNALTVKPYNHTFAEPDKFSERIARNISLLISNESYLNHVADPAAGSYFIENYTIQLADAAWNLFLHIEEQEGMISAFTKGFIQAEIEKSWNEKLRLIQSDRVIIGVNKYCSAELEAMKNISSNRNNYLMNNLRILPYRNLAESWKSN